MDQSTGSCFRRAGRALMAMIVLVLIGAQNIQAQDDEEKKLGWFFTAELSLVRTNGNSESSTIGFGGTARRVWERSALLFEGGGTQTQSTLKTRTAVGISPTDFDVVVDKTTKKTAQLYFVRGRYDYNISNRTFVFGGADWLRNIFAGIDSRFLVALGAGNRWVDSDRMRFDTDYGATYTFEENVVENPTLNTDFPGVRLAYNFWRQLTGSTEFTSVLISDWNFDNTSDIRLDFTNALPISISDRLAFKPALRLMWRNDPALTEMELFTPGGDPTGDKVFVPLEKLDSFFNVALVFKL